MKETTIRLESYGIIIYVPDELSYFRVNDEALASLIRNQNFDEIKNKYNDEYKLLRIGKNNVRYVDNMNFDSDIFVPLEIYFDYTSKCNMQCTYCYNRENLNNCTMPQEDVKRLMNNFYDLGIMRVHLAGGEPTIDYDGLKNYIKSGREKNMIISMATNGSLLNDRICELLTTNDLLSVSISLDRADEKTNDLQRGNNSYKRACDGIKRLIKYKKKNNSNLEICIKPVFDLDMTEHDVKELIDLSENLGIDKLKFANPERCEYHELGYYGKVREKYYSNLEMISNIRNNYQGNLTITTPTNPAVFSFDIGLEENNGCIGGQELLTINPNGAITPCLMNHYDLGNIYKYNSLSEYLLLSDKLLEYKKIIQNQKCRKCILHSSCRGGCQVRKKVEYGKIENKDPLCPAKYVNQTSENQKVKTLKRINVYHSL